MECLGITQIKTNNGDIEVLEFIRSASTKYENDYTEDQFTFNYHWYFAANQGLIFYKFPLHPHLASCKYLLLKIAHFARHH